MKQEAGECLQDAFGVEEHNFLNPCWLNYTLLYPFFPLMEREQDDSISFQNYKEGKDLDFR